MTAGPGRWDSRRAAVTFLLVASCTVGADLLSKWYVHSALPQGDRLTVIPFLIEFQVRHNPGAAFSMGAGRKSLLIVFSMIACVAISWAAWRYGCTSRALLVGLALLLGGAAGNLYDRLLYDGMVRDFVHLHLGQIVSWPGIFNVADVAIVAGCALVVWNSFRSGRQAATPRGTNQGRTGRSGARGG